MISEPLRSEEQALENLGAVLGRGGAAEQGEALRRAEKQLELFLDLEEKERMKRNKVRAALGAGAGVMLAILLLGGEGMELELIFRLAALGIVVAVLNILLARAGREEQALMVTIAGLVIALVMVVQEISEFFSLTRRLFGF